jgi:HSP20 family protein
MTAEKDVATRADSAPAAKSGEARVLRPAVDIFENGDKINLFADLPGVAQGGLGLEVDGKTLNISGEVQIDMPEGMESIHADVRSTRYRRAFTLSDELDTAKITATLKDGLLTVTIPKREEVRPRRIEITSE